MNEIVKLLNDLRREVVKVSVEGKVTQGPPEGAVPVAVNRLSRVVLNLEEVLNNLYPSVEIATRTEVESLSEPGPGRTFSCKLSEDIHILSDRIDSVSVVLADIISRIEL